MEANDGRQAQGAYIPQELLKEISKVNNRLLIGIPRERCEAEKRLPLTPEAVDMLTDCGHRVLVESGAGLGINYSDNHFSEAGAEIVDTPAEVFQADLILKILPPLPVEIALMRPRTTVFSLVQFNLFAQEAFELMMAKRITAISYELMADAYSKLYNIPSTGLRFFTVYGPAGRPDMAYFGFTNKLVKGETIKIFNYGNCKRDFTYVDDIVEGVVRVMKKAPDKKNGEDGLPIPPYAVYNIGNQNPENLLDFVQILSEELVRAKVLPEDYDFEAHKELVPMQPGDVPVTYADTSALERDFGYKPSTSLRAGLRKFAEWYAEFYK